MPFTKKTGRPRKYTTAKEAKEAARSRRAAWELRNQEERRERRLARQNSSHTWHAQVISWPGIDCSVRELLDDDCFQYPVPDDPLLATLYRSLKNIQIHISVSFGGAPEDWLKNSGQILLHSRGAALERHLGVMLYLQRSLRPYVRAMSINYDTHAVYLNKDNVWGPLAAELHRDVLLWADDLDYMMRKYYPND
ncbi:hypothetical protein CYLTODRAFT_495442 [Cylindrobasidium torrendii FP15055 ss-10]|uniref:Uncharacterized protein n=1 Tax=Cylindrobasidium torrendii FP15055 ss-10 TaxID=1314674 RepID=A0A0D7ARK8_9AGAR|nr:hypothetical protein CYLTODRAFT_495442 [Cylindrobasidium torrendii FP15055 ss-10]